MTAVALSSEAIDERIRNHRTANIALLVKGDDGRPLADTDVTLKQENHVFGFGSNAFKLGRCRNAKDNAAYKRRFRSLLNFATLPFYWGSYEREPGRTRQADIRRMAEWCRRNGIRAKGHPLCWHEVPCGWLEGRSLREVERLQLDRITREVGSFAGLIDTWDVLNEVCVMPHWNRSDLVSIPRLCRKLGRVELIKRCLQTARRANPGAVLILNDYDVSPRYEKLIADCLKAGVHFDVIGIQSHMHAGYWGAAKTWDVLERFARFGKPLHFTEATLLSGRLKTDGDWHKPRRNWRSTRSGEARQEREVVEFYRLLYSHPAVAAVTWWDFSDQNAWQGAPAGFIRDDMSPKPAYTALRQLVKGDWWTGTKRLTTDAAGQVRVQLGLGEYLVSAGRSSGTLSITRPGYSRRRITCA